jgi:hypothetical protein
MGSHGDAHASAPSWFAGDSRLPGLPLASQATDLSSLSPSLLQDLLRFEHGGEQRELLEVLAACIRHTQSLAIRLAFAQQQLTLSVFPLDRLVHCPMPIADFLASDLSGLQVLLVQPASLRAPGDAEPARVGKTSAYAPLAPLLWTVALAGSRSELLPELAGQAAYRVAPGINLGGLPMPAAMQACVTRLRRQTCNLRDIAQWPGLGRERAARLLNALYLQSGLIVSRTHPAATNEGWGGYR